MANPKTKRVSIRRDRRKAKQTGFKREGRDFGKKIGHGGGVQGGEVKLSKTKKKVRISKKLKQRAKLKEKTPEPLTFTLGEVFNLTITIEGEK